MTLSVHLFLIRKDLPGVDLGLKKLSVHLFLILGVILAVMKHGQRSFSSFVSDTRIIFSVWENEPLILSVHLFLILHKYQYQ